MGFLGVDEYKNAGLNEGTTDHFIVIVGSGQDTKGNYFLFYDNASNLSTKGASLDNKIYYDPIKGQLIGGSQVYPTHGNDYYKVSQIRKNVGDQP